MRLQNVTRKALIRIAGAVMIPAIAALLLFSGEDVGEVRLTVSAVSSNRVSVTLTNSRKTSVEYFLRPWNSAGDGTLTFFRVRGKLMGHHTETIERPAYFTNRWCFALNYESTLPKPFGSSGPPVAAALRAKAANYAWQHDWKRISRWLDPMPRMQTLFGPEMLGNKPVPTESAK